MRVADLIIRVPSLNHTSRTLFSGAMISGLLRMEVCRWMLWMLATGVSVIILTGAAAIAQTPDALSLVVSSPQQVATQDGLPDTVQGKNAEPLRDVNGTNIMEPSMALSAEHILRLLQDNPDLVVELKSQMTDRMSEQGVQINENEISDQMLFSQIAENASLRVRITVYLRARGYVTDSDIEASRLEDANTASSVWASQMQGKQGLSQSASSLRYSAGMPLPDAVMSAGGLPRTMDGTGMAITATPRRNEQANLSTDEPKVLRRPAPYNMRSLHDIYTQIPDRTAPLKRFGSDVFVNRDAGVRMRSSSGIVAQLDVPIGPDYVLGAGDSLQISLWGGVTQSVTLTIGRDGRLMLPEAGSIEVAGLTMERAQQLIENTLKQQYRNVQVAVTVARLHTVRVYVVGDVQRPGGYDISSLATPLSALFAAGGPTAMGSLRIARHLRSERLVETVDLYDFLLNGIRNGSSRFESGDTLQIPSAGAQVAVSGSVKRPAIYELKPGETTLDSVIDSAGGLTAAASLGNITIERIDANRQRETVTLPGSAVAGHEINSDALKQFSVMDGDRIYVAPILPFSERVVYLEGHVVRPGRLSYRDGIHISDILQSYRDLLPEPAEHGEIVRLIPPDLHAETIDFDVSDVLIGNANIELEPFDTIRVFGRYEIDAPKVTIRGEVLRPGTYPMSKGMTAAQLVRMAGGFKRAALLESADLTSYDIVKAHLIAENLVTIRIGAAVSGVDPNADVALKPGDTLSVHQITGWNDIGESVTIQGQVKYPGSYGFKDGERLSSVLRRAGGLLATAYPMGAVLERDQVRELEQKSREELIRQIEANAAGARLSPNAAASDQGTTLQLIRVQQEQVLTDLKNHPPTGRMVIHISTDIASWENTPADIELRPGDVLTIPKQPGFVLVTGQVYNATALAYAPCKSAEWYLSRAGGANTAANRKEVFIIRANGTVIGRHSRGWLEGDVLSTRLNPGDVVVVPQKIIGTSNLWRNLLSAAQVASSIAITASLAAL